MWLLGVLVLIAACGDHSRFKYESVPGDPLNARIYTLDNGLKVYMTVNKDQPRIQTYVAVRAGGKNDPAETTGLAHYFEHLMFKGTDSFGTQNYEQEKPMLDRIEALFEVYRKTTDEAQRTALYRQIDSVSYEASKIAIPNEYDKLMAAIGATGTNAYTSYDQTVFEEDIPSNQVENWAKIQADRFQHPVIRGFHTELEAVYEEKNMSLTKDNRKVIDQVMAGLFPHHPYGTQTILGTCHKDVKGITSAQIADGSAFDLTKEQLADIAAKDLVAQPAPAKPFPAVEVPETVTIGALSNDFEPSVFPHRKIYEALVKGAADSGLASAFHTSPTAMCAACHHNSPIADLKTPPKCASCHGIEADKMAASVNKPSLKAAYHQQCMACHDRMKIEKPAATDCAGCHTPRVK